MKIRSSLLLCALALTTACSDNDNNDTVDLAPLLERYVLSSTDSVPEGVAFDSQERNFYATSLQGASITRIAADGTESVFRTADNRASLLGVKVDAERRRLWVCARAVDDIDNRVWVYDLDSAEMSMEFLLGALTTNGDCNDLALDESGNAYVTDPVNPSLYRLDPDTGMGSILASDALLADGLGAGLGQNGIAVTEDGSALIVAKFLLPGLVRVSLPDASSISAVTLTGDSFPSPDGIAFVDGDLYTVSNESVNRVRPNAGFTSGEVVSVPQISGLSTATVADGDLYVIKSDVTNFVLGSPLQTPFEIFKVDLTAFNQ